MKEKLKNNIGFIALILILCLIIAMFFIPWISRNYAYRGTNAEGNEVILYVTKQVSLFHMYTNLISWQPGSAILFFIICIGIPFAAIVFGILTIIYDGNKFSKLFAIFMMITIADFAITYFVGHLATIGA